MKPKRIDLETGQYVGRGEDAAYEIFCKWYGEHAVRRWIKISSLINLPWEDYSQMEKKTVDLVVKIGFWDIIVRLQDDSHKGPGKSLADRIQKEDIEKNPFRKVVSIFESDAPELFKDLVNEDSELEIWLHFLDQGLLLCPSCHSLGRVEIINNKAFCDACGNEVSINLLLE